MIGIIIGEVNRQVGRVVLSSLSVSNIIGIADDSSQNHGNAGHSITARRYLVVVTLPRCQYSDGTSGNISSWWHCSWEYVCFKIFSVKIQEGGRGEYGLDLIITPKWRVQTVILASFWQVSFHGIINGFSRDKLHIWSWMPLVCVFPIIHFVQPGEEFITLYCHCGKQRLQIKTVPSEVIGRNNFSSYL